VTLSSGTFNITAAINVGADNLVFSGQGPTTILNRVTATNNNYCMVYQFGPNFNITLRDFRIKNNNIGNPATAFDKCIFINGNPDDITLSNNILIEGIVTEDGEAENICIDYSEYITVRNCICKNGAWAGITLAFCRFGDIYNNHIEQCGNNNPNGGSLGFGINIQSAPFTSVHDNWIRGCGWGGIGISGAKVDAAEKYFPSEHISVYGNHIVGCGMKTSGTEVTGATGIWVGTTGGSTRQPKHIDLFANHVKNLYLAACPFDLTGNANGEWNLSKAGSRPFEGIVAGDEVYLTAQGGVAVGTYPVGAVDLTTYSWINIAPVAQISHVTPANVEIGDTFGITLTIAGVSHEITFVATAATVKNAAEGLQAAAAAAKAAATAPWTEVTATEDDLKVVLKADTAGTLFTLATSAVNVGGGTNTQTLTATLFYGFNADGSPNMTHGGSGQAVCVNAGTEINIHNNYLDGQATAAAILLGSGITAGSIVREYDNYVGPNYTNRIRSLSTSEAVDFSGRIDETPIARTAATTCRYFSNGQVFTNTGAGAAVTFTLPKAKPGRKYKFRVTAAQQMRVDPEGTETIAIAGVQQAPGKYVWADAPGEGFDLECIVAGKWEMTNAIGTITAEA
jgi:hypothetical protein